MVMKKTTGKKSGVQTKRTVSKVKPFAYIATAKVTYGPFANTAIAKAVAAKVVQVPRAKVTSIVKGKSGYTFAAMIKYGLTSATQKKTALTTIKKFAPSAKVTFSKA